MFALYLMGAVSAMAAAAVFKRLTSRGGPLLPFYMEMPPYQVPRLRTMAAEVWTAAAAFLRKVSSIILVTTAVLWVLLNLPLRHPDQLSAAGVDTQRSAAVSAYVIDHSFYAASIGRAVEPVFAPLGFDWRINVGILSAGRPGRPSSPRWARWRRRNPRRPGCLAARHAGRTRAGGRLYCSTRRRSRRCCCSSCTRCSACPRSGCCAARPGRGSGRRSRSGYMFVVAWVMALAARTIVAALW